MREAPRRARHRAIPSGPLSEDGLDAPMPGSLLVLLSRLHRSESGAETIRIAEGSE